MTARTWRHIRRGTLLRRLLEYRQDALLRWREASWARRTRERPAFIARPERGVTMRLYRDSKLSHLIYCHDFERAERSFVRAFLRPGDLFVDIGANIGLFTLIAARRVGRAGAVIAFEPSGATFRRLQENVALSGLRTVTCHRLALSSQAGTLPLTVALDGWDAWSSLARPTGGERFAAEPVECVTWDAWAGARGLAGRVALMKIDVEGWEAHVLRGAAATLRRPDAPALLVEFTDAAAETAGHSCAALYRELEGLGYALYAYDPRRRLLRPDPLRPHYPYTNLVALKDPAQAATRLRGHTRVQQ